MNQTTIAGHLGADPEVRFTSSGQKVTTLRLAAKVRRSAKDKDDTIWWRVTIWGEHLDKMISYCKKGSALIVIGEMSKPEIFTDREGRSQISMNVTASDILFSPFGKPSESSERKEYAQPEMAYSSPAMDSSASTGQGKDVCFSEDEIPF